MDTYFASDYTTGGELVTVSPFIPKNKRPMLGKRKRTILYKSRKFKKSPASRQLEFGKGYNPKKVSLRKPPPNAELKYHDHGQLYTTLTNASTAQTPAYFQEESMITIPRGDQPNQRNGRKRCGIEVSLSKRYVNYTTENYVARVKEVHGDRYDYSLTEYVNTETKVKIICSLHGVFEQRPKCHEAGKGCVKCRNENTTYNFIQKYRDNIELGNSPGIIYILKVQGNGEEFLKLGITSNKSGRFKRYRKQFKDIGYSHEILFEAVMPNYQTAMLENEIFKRLRREDKIYKPLQEFSGKSECVLLECFGELQNLILEHTEDKYFE